jgi:hypothetical protein
MISRRRFLPLPQSHTGTAPKTQPKSQREWRVSSGHKLTRDETKNREPHFRAALPHGWTKYPDWNLFFWFSFFGGVADDGRVGPVLGGGRSCFRPFRSHAAQRASGSRLCSSPPGEGPDLKGRAFFAAAGDLGLTRTRQRHDSGWPSRHGHRRYPRHKTPWLCMSMNKHISPSHLRRSTAPKSKKDQRRPACHKTLDACQSEKRSEEESE